MKSFKVLSFFFIALVVAFFGVEKNAVACCGQVVDIWEYTISPQAIDPCAEEKTTISGSVYEYYWYAPGFEETMNMTITITDGDSNTVRTITGTATKDVQGQSYGVDDDGDGSIDEDQSYPVQGVDDDNDGRVDEDGGWSGDQYGDFSFSFDWDARNDDGDMVPAGCYDVTIMAQAGQMGTATVYGTVCTTTEEPCCVEGGLVNIDPDTINKQRKGKWITGHVTPATGYTAADIIAGKIVSINGVKCEIDGEVKSPDEEGAVLKFRSAEVIKCLPEVPMGPAGHGDPGRVEDVEICVEVTYADGSVNCAICDQVDVIDEGKGRN